MSVGRALISIFRGTASLVSVNPVEISRAVAVTDNDRSCDQVAGPRISVGHGPFPKLHTPLPRLVPVLKVMPAGTPETRRSMISEVSLSVSDAAMCTTHEPESSVGLVNGACGEPT